MKKNETLFFFKHNPVTEEMTEIVCPEAGVEPLYLVARDIVRTDAGFEIDRPNFGKMMRWMDETGKTLLLRYEKRIGDGKMEVIKVPIYPDFPHEKGYGVVVLLAKDSVVTDIADGSLRIVTDMLDSEYRSKLTNAGLVDYTNYCPSYGEFAISDVLADFIKKLKQEPNLDVREELRKYFANWEPNFYLDDASKGGWACGYRDNAYELDVTEIFLSAMEEAVRAMDSDPQNFNDLYFAPRYLSTKEYAELCKQSEVWDEELSYLDEEGNIRKQLVEDIICLEDSIRYQQTNCLDVY